MKKRKIFYIIVVVILVVGGIVYGQFKSNQQTVVYETAKVQRGELKQTVDATGNIESANDLDLRFESAGRVARIYKKVNDEVWGGELIMDLDLSQLNAAVAQAEAQVAQAQANLDKQLAGNTTEYISQLQSAVDKAKADLSQVQGSVPGVEQSKLVQNAYDDMIATLLSVQNVLASSLTAADNILGVDNSLANDDFENVLSALNPGKLNTAKNKYYAAKSAKLDADSAINKLNSGSPHDGIDWAIELSDDALLTSKEMLFAVADALDSTAPLGDLSQSELDTLKTNIQTERSSIATKYTALVSDRHDIDSARSSYFSYQALVDKAEAALRDAQNPPREVDVAGYRAALVSSQASLAGALANRNKARLFSPTNGVIGKIIPKVGEQVSSQDAAVNLVSPHFEVKVDIPETDIVKIKLGDLAEIKLDAYGDEVKFAGKVVEIEKGQTVIQDVVYYRVTVSMEDNKEHQILNGMTANVVFATESRENVLYIPQRAVRTNGSKYVRILENNVIKEVNIKTGLRGDNGLVEILEGLREGQEIIVNVTEAKK